MVPGALGVGFVVASFGAAVGALSLVQYLYTQRANPGAAWFMGNMASVAVFCLTYGLALLIFDPTVRAALAAVVFVCLTFMGPFFLAFGLDYTGRGDLIRTPLFGASMAVPVLSAGLTATNAVHGLVWTDFQIDPVFGLATVTYTVQPWGVFALLFSLGTAAVGSLLLVGAILSYGALYRREATAIILSTVPPSVGGSLWLFSVGPVPQLHLMAPFMLLHVALDAYAFVGTHMFETNPATQRTAERTGLDSLSDPVLVLDAEGQIVQANDRARALFSAPALDSFPASLEAVLGAPLETLRERGELSPEANGGATFALSYTPLTDPSGDSVGSMLVLYDITEQRRREQQLGVLNRVLRHNLRNEMTVISGYAELLESNATDPTHVTQAKTIVDASDRLNAIAEKARTFEEVQQRTTQPASLSVADVLADVVTETAAAGDDATVDWTVTPPSLRLRTDEVVLSLLLRNLVQNAVVHAETPDPTVTITVTRPADADDTARFEIRDQNDPIPDQEIQTLRAGEETPLQHGQGIGLWIVYWCVQQLHADIRFAYDDGNVLIVTVPPMTP